MNPCIPSNWTEYKIRFRYGKSVYNIKVLNKTGKNTGVSKILLNGIETKENQILLENNGNIYTIEVEI